MNARKGARTRNNLSVIRGQRPARPAAFTRPTPRIVRHEPSPWRARLRATVVAIVVVYVSVCAILVTSDLIVYLSRHLVIAP